MTEVEWAVASSLWAADMVSPNTYDDQFRKMLQVIDYIVKGDTKYS